MGRRLVADPKYKPAPSNSGLKYAAIEFVPKAPDRIPFVQRLIRNGGDVGSEFQAPIRSFEDEINRPRSQRRLMLNTAESGKSGKKDHFPFRRDVILRNLVEALDPVMKSFPGCEGRIGIKASLNDPPGEERHV
jgi:hypothetical protein